MKRILALILTLVCMATMFSVPVMAEETGVSSLTQDQITLLSYIGVYNEEQDLKETITKAEFAALLSKFAFGLDAEVELYATGDKAADVKSDHIYYTEICALLSSGYISTNKFGSFLPDTDLNINTAYEFILRTMGYSETEDFKAGKYARIAAQKDLSDGLAGASGSLTYENAYILIYNMLYTDVSDMMSLVYSHISSNKELLYMESRLGLHKIKGIVTDDGNYSLYGESAIKKGQISIDGKEAMQNSTGLGDLVGKNVAGFYKEGDDDMYELVCLYEQTDKNTSIVLDSQNILKPYTNNTYEYYEDEFSTKTKKVKVKSGATIIYNNKALRLSDTFTQADFIPENGFVKLYDNNGDGTMDIIRIEDYKEAVATTLDKGDEIFICMKFTNEVINLDEVTYSVYDKYGAEMEYNKIKDGSVISVLKSFDGETYKFVVSTDTATAQVKSILKSTPSQRGYLITAEGGKYSFSQWLEDHYGTPELGSTYKFSFDAFGRIVDITKVAGTNDWLAGHLIQIKAYQDIGGDIRIRMFNDAGVWEILEPADKVTVLGQDDVTHSYSPSELATAFSNNTTGIENYCGVIRYRLNSKGEVISIELPMYYGTTPTKPDRLYCLLDTITAKPETVDPADPRKYAAVADYYLYKNGTNVSFGGYAYTDASAKVFITPQDANLTDLAYKEDYEVTNTSILIAGASNGIASPVRVYGTDYRSHKASYVTTNKKPAVAALERGPKWIVSVRQTTDPKTGEVVYQVETVDKNASKAKYYIEKDYYETGIFGIAKVNDPKTPIQLAPGDGIYNTVYNGYIVNAVVMFDADQTASDGVSTVTGMTPGITTTKYDASNAFCNPFGAAAYGSDNLGTAGTSWKYNAGQAKIFVGWVYDLDGNFITITNQNPETAPIDISKTTDDGVAWETIYSTGSYMLKRDEIGRIKNTVLFEKGALKDIKPYTKYGANCTKVILIKASYEIDTIVLINKN